MAERILIVEDEAGIARALERGLTADGYDVTVADNGIDGLELARTTQPDLIVLDLMLPGMSGEQICRELRAAGDDVAILMLTAKDTDRDQITGLGLGADDYLVKPFSYQVLRSRIAAVRRRVERNAAVTHTEILSVDDLTIDVDQHRVTRGDSTIDLSPRMLALLAHLVANEGLVLTKGQLLEAVWGHDFDGDDNVVEVAVSRLRQAVDTPFERNNIQTVRGLGYRIRAMGQPS